MTRYLVDLVSRTTVVVEASSEETAISLAEKYTNEDPSFIPYFEFEDGGIEETDYEPDIIEGQY
jgi:hypothetical protein